MKTEPTKPDPQAEPDDLLIVELDERLEFSAATIDSELERDVNGGGCVNTSPCTAQNYAYCNNYSSCC